MKKVEIKKIHDNNVETFYPKTSADIVQYDANRTVYAVLLDLISRVEALEDNVNVYNHVYATDVVTGNTITDDGGDGVILIAADDSVVATDDNGVVIDDGSGDNVILMHEDS